MIYPVCYYSRFTCIFCTIGLRSIVISTDPIYASKPYTDSQVANPDKLVITAIITVLDGSVFIVSTGVLLDENEVSGAAWQSLA